MELLRTVTIRQILYFVEVAEAKSFRHASAALHMSQPPLTQQIKALEQALNTELFDRRRRQIELTAAGQELLVAARDLIASLNGTLEHVRAIGRGLQGTVRVGFTNDFVYSRVASRLLAYNQQHPDVVVEIYVDVSLSLIEMLRKNLLDVILTVRYEIPPVGNFTEIELPSSRIVAVVPTANELADRVSISPAELATQPLIVFPSDSTLPLAIECRRLLASAGVTPKIAFVTTNTAFAVRLVSENLGIALASEYSIPPETPGVVAVPLRGRARLEHVLMHSGKHLSPAHTNLLDALLSG